MVQVNKNTIAEIAKKSPTAEAFFTYAACRERNVRQGVSRLPAIRAQMSVEGFHPVPKDLVSMFQELARAGVGTLQGKEFKWNVPIREVGQAGSIKESTPHVEHHINRVIPQATKDLVIMFDTNKEVSIKFTANLTKDEINFIAAKLLKECK